MLIEDLSSDPKVNVARRPTLEKIAGGGAIGRARLAELYRMFYVNGPGNGTMLSLPFDQLVEHGVGHMFKWDRAAEPEAVIELANRGTFSALALSIGQAEKYQQDINPSLPLIVKVDGHFLVGKEAPYDRHSTMSSVERAVKAGANAIGFTLYFGGNETEQDVERCAQIVEAAHQMGKPVFAWMYARGPLPGRMGADSLYWCAQAVSAGESLGVDVVKQKVCAFAKNRDAYTKELQKRGDGAKGFFYGKMPEVDELIKLEPTADELNEMSKEKAYQLQVRRLSYQNRVAPRTLQINSGGLKGAAEGVIETTNVVMDAGMEGAIVGRNNWGRPIDEALELNAQMIELMQNSAYHRNLTEPRFTKKYTGR